jgi:hypothetical protein
MKSIVGRWQLWGVGTLAIAVLGSGSLQSASAQTVTEIQTLTPLPQSEGNARDLTGTFAKDSAIWLGGVGGEGDIEATESEENPYELRSQPSDNSLILLPDAKKPDQTRIQLGQF